ncbi:hypothetical protein ACF08W_23380 [Streptomyces sp. NPDC015144]|uniref:hypothetical protein n=1 Tax=Streptomyces sp. NPDC015144 TaxID=3364944 RepID=UPI0036F78E5A
MRSTSVRRTARLGACATVVAAGLLTAGLAVPAAAQDLPQTDRLWIQAPSEQSLPLGADLPDRPLDIGIHHDNDNFAVTDGLLSVDASGLAGVAQVQWPSNCAPSGSTAVCAVDEVPVGGDDYSPQVRLGLKAAAGAGVGAHGRISYEAVATGGPDGTLEAPHGSFETEVTVGAGPDLAVSGLNPVKGARPGDVLTVPFTVTNRGGERSEGLRAVVTTTYGVTFPEEYAECVYGTTTGGDDVPMHTATCDFDQVVEAGGTFTLPRPLRVALAGHAYRERVEVVVRPGNGATDLAEEDNYDAAGIQAENTADFEARGARVAGAAGETVTAALAFRNNGPAWIGNLGSGDSVAAVDLTVPEGVTVTSAPAGCEPRTLSGGYHPNPVGAPRYSCEMPIWTLPDTERAFPFELRIDRVVPDAAGRVVLTTGGANPVTFPFDPQPANNTAWLVVNPTSAS